MTEADWLSCPDPNILQFYEPPGATARKLRLLACACCQRGELLFTDPRSRRALQLAEQYADGHVSGEKLDRAAEEAHAAQQEANPGFEGPPPRKARWYAAVAASGASQRRYPSRGVTVNQVDDGHGKEPDFDALAREHFRVAYGVMEVLGVLQAMSWAVAWHTTGVDVEDPAWAAAEVAERAYQMDLLRHVIGNPFRPLPAPLQLPSTVVQLAVALDGGSACAEALHDALLGAGHPELAEHFRDPNECHPKGCFALDFILSRE